MPSASPTYTLSCVFSEAETPQTTSMACSDEEMKILDLNETTTLVGMLGNEGGVNGTNADSTDLFGQSKRIISLPSSMSNINANNASSICVNSTISSPLSDSITTAAVADPGHDSMEICKPDCSNSGIAFSSCFPDIMNSRQTSSNNSESSLTNNSTTSHDFTSLVNKAQYTIPKPQNSSYDPFLCLNAMAEQSFTCNFTNTIQTSTSLAVTSSFPLSSSASSSVSPSAMTSPSSVFSPSQPCSAAPGFNNYFRCRSSVNIETSAVNSAASSVTFCNDKVNFSNIASSNFPRSPANFLNCSTNCKQSSPNFGSTETQHCFNNMNKNYKSSMLLQSNEQRNVSYDFNSNVQSLNNQFPSCHVPNHHQIPSETTEDRLSFFSSLTSSISSSSLSSLSSRTTSSPRQSLTSPPLSPASVCSQFASQASSISADFLESDKTGNHQISSPNAGSAQTADFIKSEPSFCPVSPQPSNITIKDEIDNFPEMTTAFGTHKRKQLSCSSEQSLQDMGDNDGLLSWTFNHPEHWSSAEVLDWLYFVAGDQGFDAQNFRGENFQAMNGKQLCQMKLDDFMKIEPVYGRSLYETFRKLLCGVVFKEPQVPDNLSMSDCMSMSMNLPVNISSLSPFPSLPTQSPKQQPCFPIASATSQVQQQRSQTHHQQNPSSPYQPSQVQINANGCIGMSTNEQFFKQERCDSVQEGIDITSYDFDLDDTPAIGANQCQGQFQGDYGMFLPSYRQATPVRSSCCYTAPPFPTQQAIPKRKPGRPKMKHLLGDERTAKEKKVKNQHLWEFIYETLMNPLYNPQLLRWENQRDGIFRFVQSEAVAQLWGGRKNNENMTYEKLSRAMRHYYRRGILERIEGRRLVYKFSLKAMEKAREKRQNTVRS